MIVQIQISDRVYTQLLNGNKRIQGTLALANPTEGNFNEHRRDWRPKPGTRYMRLPHGRVTVSDEQVRMNLHIRRDESIVPARAIEAESGIASGFVEGSLPLTKGSRARLLGADKPAVVATDAPSASA